MGPERDIASLERHDVLEEDDSGHYSVSKKRGSGDREDNQQCCQVIYQLDYGWEIRQVIQSL